MNRKSLRATLVLVLAAAFFAPPLSQVLCSDVCVGGTCGAEPPSALCDLDATGGCCGEAEPAAEYSAPDPTVPQLKGECNLCPCYDQAQIGNFIVSERVGIPDWTASQAVIVSPLSIFARASIAQFFVYSSDANAHGPPLYQENHALLL